MNWLEDEFLIANVLLFDGGGAPPFEADVAVKEERVHAVGRAGTLPRTGVPVLDARGLALAPGFIDVHGHSDTAAAVTPSGGSKLAQGVTTEVVGNCGFSDWIVSDEPDPRGVAAEIGATGNFRSYAELIDRIVPGINLAGLCGHNSLRLAVHGAGKHEATATEINEMKQRLADDLAAGAAGFSSGLWYVPGRFAPESEVAALASVLRGTGKPYASHLRSEGDFLIESIEEAGRIATAGDGILQISHFKVFERPNWGKLDAALAAIERLRQNGVNIAADRYPYICSGTSLRMIAPGPFTRLDRPGVTRALRESAEKRAELVRLLAAEAIDWRTVSPVNDLAPEHARFAGKNLEVIAHELGLTPPEACTALLTAASPGAVFGTMCEENLNRILALDYVFPGSDGSIRALDDAGTHPRAFGAFPRFFRIAGRHAAPEAVIRRMTALPAERFRLDGRGRVAPGFFADLVLFDPDNFDSKADYVTPNIPASGVEKVFVNGGESYRGDGSFTPRRRGRMLRIPNAR